MSTTSSSSVRPRDILNASPCLSLTSTAIFLAMIIALRRLSLKQGLDQSVPVRVGYRLELAVQPQFGEDVLSVVADGCATDEKLPGNRCCRAALRQQLQNLLLARSQLACLRGNSRWIGFNPRGKDP